MSGGERPSPVFEIVAIVGVAVAGLIVLVLLLAMPLLMGSG